jgi:hypothetical protein
MVGGLALIGLVAAPMARAQDVCVGDCNGDGMVAINELILGVNIALGSRPIADCPAFDCQGTGMVPINCLIQGVNNALEGCDMVQTRTFTVDPGLAEGGVGGSCDTCTPGAEGCVSCIKDSDCPEPQTCSPGVDVTRTGLFPDILSNANAALRFSPGPLLLELGKPDSNGVAQLRLKEDVTFSIVVVDSTCFCLTLLAEGGSGSIDCDGGTAYDTKIFQAAGQGPAWTAEYNLGDPADPGNGDLRVMGLIERVNVMDECLNANCATRDYPDPPNPFPFTTTNAIAQKGTQMLVNRGEAFECENFATSTTGALASGGAITIDPVGDTADTIRISQTQ